MTSQATSSNRESMSLERGKASITTRCRHCTPLSRNCTWCREDPNWFYYKDQSITVKSFTIHPEWSVWEYVDFMKLTTKLNSFEEHLAVVPRTETKPGLLKVHQDDDFYNFVIFEKACYVFTIIVYVHDFPEKITVSFKNEMPIGRFFGASSGIPFDEGKKLHKRRKVRYMAVKPCEILLRFLDRKVPTFCCISVRKYKRHSPPLPFDV